MIEKLIEAIEKKDSPIVVGLDPQLPLIPSFLFPEGELTLEGAAQAIRDFNRMLIDALSPLIPAVKPQIAMYEQFGLPGLSAYEETIRCAHEKGLLVIADVKRGDIGSTSKAYAVSHLGRVKLGDKSVSVFNADFATVNPYLGTEGIEPFKEVCAEEGKGLFVLVKTSNPGSAELQDKLIGDKPLYLEVGEIVERWGESLRHGGAYSDIGAVVGATHPEIGKRLRKALPHTFFLVPGYGAQGATAEDLAGFFDSSGGGAIVNSSRGIIGAWKQKDYADFGEKGFAEAAAEAVLRMKEALNRCRMHG